MTVLALLAVVPIAAHVYLGLRTDECAHPDVLVAAGHRGEESVKRDRFMRNHFSALRWKEGRAGRGNPPMLYALIRTYDAKSLYYRPATRLFDRAPDSDELAWIDADEIRLPVRRLLYEPIPGSSAATVVTILLLHDGEPVQNAYIQQLWAAPFSLLRGRRPMTGYIVYAHVPIDGIEAAEQRQAEWLTQSWQRYVEICLEN
jgi:hypothetical protein